jgi:AcrR family transcriptional regulator
LAVHPRIRRTRAESREDNRRALLAAAAEVVMEVGYHAAQLDEIAARAGLTKGAIYSIFGGKLELLRCLVEAHATSVLPWPRLQLASTQSRNAEDILEALARDYVDAVERPDARQLLAFELELGGLALRDPTTLAMLRDHEQASTQRVVEALANSPRRDGSRMTGAQALVTARLALGLLAGSGIRLITSSSSRMSARELADALIRLMPV